MATFSQSLTICKVTLFCLVRFATPSIMFSPLPPESSDPCDDFHKHSPQLPAEYSIPLIVGVEPPPSPLILHIGRAIHF
jgi:hypothetical protein